MTLKRLYQQDKLKYHHTSRKEITGLLSLVCRDIQDAGIKNLSCDRRFTTAYNAILQLRTILLYCRGYKTKGTGHHFTVFQAMKEILGTDYDRLADYFDDCRSKRNLTDYISAGLISETETNEIVREAEKFLKTVKNWLNNHYPKYI